MRNLFYVMRTKARVLFCFHFLGTETAVVFLFAVFTTVGLSLRIGQHEDVRQLMLDGSNASRILAADYVTDLLWQMQSFLFNNLLILDDVDCDAVIDETKDIKIHKVNRALNLHNVFFTHFAASCILDDRNTAVQFVKIQIFINFHAFTDLDVIQYESFGNAADA